MTPDRDTPWLGFIALAVVAAAIVAAFVMGATG